MSYNNAGPDTFPFSLTLTQPETIQFLFLSSGIIFIVGGVVALKNFGRAPILLSKIAFTVFYFLGPLTSLLGVWIIFYSVPIFAKLFIWLVFMPQFFLLILIGSCKLIPWRFSFSKFLREARSSVFIAAPCTWRISILSFMIFFMGAVYSVWIMENFKG